MTETSNSSSLTFRLLFFFVLLHILVATTLTGVGIYLTSECKQAEKVFSKHFAGFTAIFSGIFFLQGLVLACLVKLKQNSYAMLLAIFNFLTSCLIVVNESMNFRCLEYPATNFCRTYLESLNLCPIVKGRIPLVPINSTGTPYVIITPYAFTARMRYEQAILIILGCVSMVCAISTLIILTVLSKQLSEIQLPFRRHRRSIVVGDNFNAKVANAMKAKNLKLIEPKEKEVDEFERKKSMVLQRLESDKTSGSAPSSPKVSFREKALIKNRTSKRVPKDGSTIGGEKSVARKGAKSSAISNAEKSIVKSLLIAKQSINANDLASSDMDTKTASVISSAKSIGRKNSSAINRSNYNKNNASVVANKSITNSSNVSKQ